MCADLIDNHIMDTADSGYMKLDQEFDRYLAEMKPHVLKLPHKTGNKEGNRSDIVRSDKIMHIKTYKHSKEY